jgi:phosphate transport system permease protein
VTDVRDDTTREFTTSVASPAANGSTPKPRTRVPRRPRELTGTDIVVMLGCFVSAVCGVWLAFKILTQGTGWFGYLVAVFAVYLVLLYLVTSDRFDGTVAIDRVMTSVIVAGAIVLLIPLIWILFYVVSKGVTALRIGFFYKDQRGVTPILPATAAVASTRSSGRSAGRARAAVVAAPALLKAVFRRVAEQVATTGADLRRR